MTTTNNNLNTNNSLNANASTSAIRTSPPRQPSPSSMAIAKRNHPGALTVEKGTSSKNAARPIPAFLTKLFTMVNDPATDHLIKWNEPNGDSFFVVSSERFGRELLPKFFKHSNFGSFVRQLNMYGFHKVPHLNQGVLQGEIPETEMLEFTNVNFQRSQPDLLCLIQRKKPGPELASHTATDGVETPSTSLPANSTNSHNDLQAILADVAAIKKNQNLISSDLKTLQSSNAHLWKEAIANRDRNKRCQETINKILGFLAQVFAAKVSSLQDPPPGNIPELERHRSRSKNSRDNPTAQTNDLGYPSSPSTSALSLYSKLRHPRLMLEDTQRHITHKLPTEFSNGTLSYTNDKNGKNYPVAPSTPSARNSASTASSPDITTSAPFCDSSIDPNLETLAMDGTSKVVDNTTAANDFGRTNASDHSNPDAILQALFNDNFSNGGGYNFNDNIFSGVNWADVFNASGELNAGFDDNKSQQQPTFMTALSPLRITDGEDNRPQHVNNQPSSSLPSINIHNDSPNRLLADAQSQANVLENATSKVESLEAAIERLVGRLPDSLETQLPMDLDPNPIEQPNRENGNIFQPPVVSSRLGYGASDNTNGEFDTDAFIRTLVASENEDPASSVRGIGTSNLAQRGSNEMRMISPRPPPEGGGLSGPSHTANISTTAPGTKTTSFDQTTQGCPPTTADQQAMDVLDFDRILDEWACEDAARVSPIAALNPGSTLPRPSIASTELKGMNHDARRYDLEEQRGTGHQILSSLNPNSPGSSSQRLVDPSGGGSNNPSSSRLVFDLNDDDQLRRIMRKKSLVPQGCGDDPTSLTSDGMGNFQTGPLIAHNEATFPTTSSIGNCSSVINNNNGGGNYDASIIDLIGSSSSTNHNNPNVISNAEPHSSSSIKKRLLEDANHPTSLHDLMPHHFDGLSGVGDITDQSNSRSVAVQQKKSRIF